MTHRIASAAIALGSAAAAAAEGEDPVAAPTNAAGVQYMPETTRTAVVTPPPPERPPLTGHDAVAVALGGPALLTLGLFLRRHSRRQS